MICIVKKELPFAKVGEEVEITVTKSHWRPDFPDINFSAIFKGGKIVCPMWPEVWGNPFADGWLSVETCDNAEFADVAVLGR